MATSANPGVRAIDEPELPLVTVIEQIGTLLAEGTPDLYRQVCEEVERLLLYKVMWHCHHDQIRAAECLGITPTKLRTKLNAAGMLLEHSKH